MGSDPNNNSYQPIQAPVSVQRDETFEVHPPGDDSDEKYNPDIDDADDDLFMGIDRAVNGDGILRG